MQMLGTDGDLAWKQTDEGLVGSNPAGGGGEGFVTEIPADHGFCIRMTPAPEWRK